MGRQKGDVRRPRSSPADLGPGHPSGEDRRRQRTGPALTIAGPGALAVEVPLGLTAALLASAAWLSGCEGALGRLSDLLSGVPARDPVVADLPPPAPRAADFARGISLGLFASTHDPAEATAIYGRLLDEIAALGATHVQLVVEGSQRGVTSSEVGPAPGRDPRVTLGILDDTIAAAHARGLSVFLMPILRVESRRPTEWRGTIAPADRESWWRSYSTFILEHAARAERTGVELFAVGSELISMENDEAKWRGLIREVRRVYRGRLTYSANWDHFEPVGFFDALDVAGVTAYQPLAGAGGGETDEALDRGWEPFAARLRSWAIAGGHHFLFTEVGYPSSRGAAERPWDYTGSGGVDLEIQARCFRSLYRTWHGERRLAGVFVWNWFGFGGPEDAGHTPRGKPAARVLARWFRGP